MCTFVTCFLALVALPCRVLLPEHHQVIQEMTVFRCNPQRVFERILAELPGAHVLDIYAWSGSTEVGVVLLVSEPPHCVRLVIWSVSAQSPSTSHGNFGDNPTPRTPFSGLPQSHTSSCSTIHSAHLPIEVELSQQLDIIRIFPRVVDVFLVVFHS